MQKQTPSYYSVLPANVRYDKALSPNEKILFSEITALTDKNGICYAKNDYFAKLYEVDERTIRRWIKNLENNNYLKIEINKNKRDIFINNLCQNTNAKNEKTMIQGGTILSANVDNFVRPPFSIINYQSYLTKKYKKVEQKSKKFNEKFSQDLNEIFLENEKEIWNDFVEHRQKIKKPLNDLSAKKILNKLKEFKTNGYNVYEILEKSIMSGWAGVFEPIKANKPNQKQQTNTSDYIAQRVVDKNFSYVNAFKNGVERLVDGKKVGLKNENGKNIFYFKGTK